MTDTNSASDHSLLWGYPVDFWDRFGIWSLIVGAVIGVVALLLTAASAYILYRVADVAQVELASETKKSAEFIAGLNNETARLQSDNLALQTVLLPRHIALSSFSAPHNADTWFAPIAEFAGVPFVIQPTDDREARDLAGDIALAMAFVGVRAKVDENATGLRPPQLSEGVSVAYATGKPWTKEEPNQPWFAWDKAAETLADCLTKAGLSVGDAPVQRYGFVPAGEADATMNFKPLREGVVVYVGQRPVSRTIAWIRSGRPNVMGHPSAATDSNKK